MKTFPSHIQTRFTFAKALALLLLFLSGVEGWAQTSVLFTNSGTWTCPPGITSATIECWGGGGAGGSAKGSSSFRAMGGAGAGGAYAKSTITVAPGTNYTVTVGGTAATSAAVAVNGNPSWFNTVGTVFAQGGAGGQSVTVTTAIILGTGGAGSAASSIGTTTFKGGDGATSITTAGTGASPGGGGSAAASGVGNNGGTNAGGAALAGGGAGGNGASSSGSSGVAGTAPGGGGGGAWAAASTSQRNGGGGAAGQVVITYTPAGGQMVVTLPGETFTSGSGNSGLAATQTAGTSFDLTLTATLADGVTQDTTYAGAHVISYNGPSTSNGAPVYTTNVNFISGQAAVVAITLNKAETTTINATDGTLTSVASSPLTVGPGATVSYGVTASSPQAAGNPFTVTVAAKDANTNTVTTDSTTTVTMSGTGSLQFDSNGDGVYGDNSKTLTNGILTITALDGTNETVTITATDASSFTGTSGSILIIIPAKYQSRQSGNWNDFNTWQINTGGGFVNAISGQTPSSSDGTVTILTGHNVTVTAPVTIDQVTVNSGGQVTLNSGITLTIANGLGTDLDVSGIFNNAGTVTISSGATIVYESGGTYQHNFPTAGLIPTATWNPGSTCEIDNQTSGGPPTGLGQSFYNLTWNCPGQGANISMGGSLTTINGNLVVSSTGAKEFRFGASTSPVMTIGGNWIVQGGTNVTSTGAGSPLISVAGNILVTSGGLNLGSGSGTTTVNVSGNVSVTGGSLTLGSGTGNLNFDGTGTQTFTNTGTVGGAINWTVNGGSTLDIGASTVGGTGTFNVSGGGVLEGNGTVSPATTVNGSITTDTSTGTLTFATAPTLSGLTSLQINRAASPNASQVALSSGTLTYGGTLTVTNLGAALQGGDTFALFSASAYSGSFTTVNLPSLSGGMTWDVSQLAVNGTVTIDSITIAPPQISGPTGGVVTIKFFGIPTDNYIVQTTTDLTLGWTPISTNTAGAGDGSYIFTDSNATNAQQFYRAVPQ